MSDPTPIEVRQAALLAHGLSVGAGHDWHKVDADVRSALFALRPELAPPPRAGLLEEALDEVMEGPLAEAPSEAELAEARAFADALDRDGPFSSGEGPEAPHDAAVFALSPQRAPAPSVSIDDILDSVATGPFAPVIRITGEFPAEIAPPTNLRVAEAATEPVEAAPVVSLAQARSERRPAPAPAAAPRRRWYLPAMGALAAAAATLLFVVPGVSLHESAPTPALEGAPTPSSAPVATSADSTRPAPKKRRSASSGSAGPTAQAPAPDAAPAQAARAEDAAVDTPGRGGVAAPAKRESGGDYGGAEGERALAKDAEDREPAPLADDYGSLEALGYLAGGNTADTSVAAGRDDALSNSGLGDLAANTGYAAETRNADAPAEDPVFAEAELEDQGELEEERDERTAAPAAGSAPPTEPEPEPVDANDGMSADDADDMDTEWAPAEEQSEAKAKTARQATVDEVEETAGIVMSTESRGRSRRGTRKPQAAPSAPAPSGGAAAYGAPSDRSAPPELGLLEPSLAERWPDLWPRWSAAYALELRGDFVGAALALTSLARSQSNADVVVDAAVRAARLWLRVGDTDRALAAFDRAQAVSPSSYRLKAARADLERALPTTAEPASGN